MEGEGGVTARRWINAVLGGLEGRRGIPRRWSVSVFGRLLLEGVGVGCSRENILFHWNTGRYWEMIERLKITHFYTAPTALRMLIKAGDDYVTKYDRSSVRILGCG